MAKKTIKAVEQTLKYTEEKLQRAEAERDRERTNRIYGEEAAKRAHVLALCKLIREMPFPETAMFTCGMRLEAGFAVSHIWLQDLRAIAAAAEKGR